MASNQSPQEIVRDLEIKLPVNDMYSEGYPAWQIIKPYLFFKLRQQSYSESSHKSLKLSWAFSQLITFITCLPLLFKKRKNLIISNSYENRVIDGENKNKLFFKLIEGFGDDYVLLERPVIGSRLSDHVNRIPVLPLMGLNKLVSYLINVSISEENLLKEEIKHLGINFNYTKPLKEFHSYRLILRPLMRIIHPKIIYLSDYYNTFNLAVIAVAREM